MNQKNKKESLSSRRSFIKKSFVGLTALTTGTVASSLFNESAALANSVNSLNHSLNFQIDKEPTQFIHACMTLAYRNFPLERALQGIKKAGYNYVAWGTRHRNENGENQPVLAETATPDEAEELASRCRDMGLEPVQMFSTIYPDQDDAVELLTNRIKQASAAELKYVLVFGPTDGGDPELWVSRFQELAPIAADYGVTFLLKQHGGETTGTGEALSEIIRELDHPNIHMSYDAGNVMWYQSVDPVQDIATCADLISGFCLKDCRNFPTKTTSAPGFGEIDHYQLFSPVEFTGKTITLTYENIFPSYLGMPNTAEEIDLMAIHTKQYMEYVLAGLQKAVTDNNN
ncbi:MAG: sugar phosphate isomerase/epimerase [Balneolaceae bacterium]|nr:sugar phosphate isomerase/epimerase [Balneolaceae bacterium]MDR9408269.1 sugar phosphate isomerase/epimerase [Balneolaceae bacterium]